MNDRCEYRLQDGRQCTLRVGGADRPLLVDEVDYPRLRKQQIIYNGGRPVRQFTRGGRIRRQTVARFLLNPPRGVRVLFRNGDPFDCRRENMYLSPNGTVRFDRQRRHGAKWAAVISVNNRSYFLGHWPTREWAREACELAAPVAAELRGKRLSIAQTQRALDLAVGRRVDDEETAA